MFNWAQQLNQLLTAHNRLVMVTVLQTKGSTPREAGAKFFVMRTKHNGAMIEGTIGGGNLEYQATQIAAELLSEPKQQQTKLKYFSLAAGLGMCCGGVVELLFEVLDQSSVVWLKQWIDAQQKQQTAILVTSLHKDAATKQVLINAAVLNRNASLPNIVLQAVYVMMDSQNNNQESSLIKIDNSLFYMESVAEKRNHLYLFGAGHVGQAIVNVLQALPWQITWVDTRDDCLSPNKIEQLPTNVSVCITDSPEFEIEQAEENAYFLVMTHDHAQDLELCEQIIKKGNAHYFGVIGSKTKRLRFEHRLRAKGLPESKIKQMVCPIGIDGISSKEAHSIAVSVIAQLLQQAERTVNMNPIKVTAYS